AIDLILRRPSRTSFALSLRSVDSAKVASTARVPCDPARAFPRKDSFCPGLTLDGRLLSVTFGSGEAAAATAIGAASASAAASTGAQRFRFSFIGTPFRFLRVPPDATRSHSAGFRVIDPTSEWGIGQAGWRDISWPVSGTARANLSHTYHAAASPGSVARVSLRGGPLVPEKCGRSGPLGSPPFAVGCLRPFPERFQDRRA